MKKGIRLLLAIMSLATTSAKNINNTTNKIGVTNRYNDAVTFVEKNIKFHIFLNGDFDFNTHYKKTKYVDYNGKRVKINKNIRIERDYRGRIKRVGNTFINYNRNGNVKRIGGVYIDYRFGKLIKVGNLKIKYDRWNNPRFFGNVKQNDYCENNNYYNNTINIDVNLGRIFNYSDAYFYKRAFKQNYRKYKEDRNYFYYRVKPNAKTGKYGKILKRRKSKNYVKKHTKKRIVPEQKGKSRRNR